VFGTPLLIAIFTIELFSHNLTIAVARPWCSLFLPVHKHVNKKGDKIIEDFFEGKNN
jgi:predicted secreted Zn-dependent protease